VTWHSGKAEPVRVAISQTVHGPILEDSFERLRCAVEGWVVVA
jgi:hypothetical protein